MKNKTVDARNHVMTMLERLDDDKLTGDRLREEIERGKVVGSLVGKYVDVVRVECQAAKTMHDIGLAVPDDSLQHVGPGRPLPMLGEQPKGGQK